MAVLMTPPYLQFFDANGNPLSGGKIYTYAASTTTPKATYTDESGLIPLPNPIILDSAGRATPRLIGSYKFVVTDANDVVIETTDDVTAFNTLADENEAYFETFSGNGTQTVFTTSQDLGTEENGLDIEIFTGLQILQTNGNFATDTDWTKGAGWTIGSGVATAAGAISTAISQTAAFPLVQGQAYRVTYTVTRSAGGLIPSIGGVNGVERTASGTYNEVIIAGSTQVLAFTGNAFTGTLDNVSINLVTETGWSPINPNAYTINGTSLTFAVAPPVGTNNIQVRAPSLLLGAASAAAAAAEASATAALASEVAADAAEAGANAAALTAVNAAASATSSASTATTQAGIATTQAGNAAAAAATATTQAGLATTNGAAQVALATTQANNAAASAVLAGSTFIATSTTSNTIGTGSKSFTTQTNKNFQAGQFMTVVDSASNANYMFGRVTSYDNGTGALVFDSQEVGGTGTKTSWNISISATTLSAGGGGGYLINKVREAGYTVGLATAISIAQTIAVSANTLYATPFMISEDDTFTRIGINVTTLSAGSARLGIYNWEEGAPTTLVADLGTVSTSSTGEKEITISQSLSAGIYALCAVFEATPTVRRQLVQNPLRAAIYGYNDSSTNPPTYISVAHSYGALPSSFGSPTYETADAMPAIWLRRV